MKASEIRVGNLLRSYLTEKIVVADWLVIKHISDGNVQNLYDDNTVYEPIELTPEILEKCGFKFTNTTAVKVYNEFGNIFQLNKIDDNYFFTWGNVPMPYVHTLQNLYYFLVGEELDVNL